MKEIMANGMDKCMITPPSTILKAVFQAADGNLEILKTDQETLARKTLLSETDVGIWLKHLAGVKARRKAGAENEAFTS